MFSFFKKKNKEVPVKDVVWLTIHAKHQAIRSRLMSDPSLTVITWDHRTADKLSGLEMSEEAMNRIIPGVQANKRTIGIGPVLFAEHLLSSEKEQSLFKDLGLTRAEVFSSLDDNVLSPFMNESFRKMVKDLGMNEDEPLEHPMISSAIRKVQDKYRKERF